MTEPRVEDFLCISRRNGCNLIRGFDCALHKVQIAVIFENINVARRYSNHILYKVKTILSLISDIVNGENVLNVVEAVFVSVKQIVVHGNKRALPIVGVDYLWVEINVAEHFENSSAEENISFRVVKIAVKTIVTLEVIFIIKKIICNAVHFLRENAAVLMAPADRHREVGYKVHFFLLFGLDCIDIIWHYNTRVVTGFNKSLGKRTRNVRKSAARRKRKRFACRIENIHNHNLRKKMILLPNIIYHKPLKISRAFLLFSKIKCFPQKIRGKRNYQFVNEREAAS